MFSSGEELYITHSRAPRIGTADISVLLGRHVRQASDVIVQCSELQTSRGITGSVSKMTRFSFSMHVECAAQPAARPVQIDCFLQDLQYKYGYHAKS